LWPRYFKEAHIKKLPSSRSYSSHAHGIIVLPPPSIAKRKKIDSLDGQVAGRRRKMQSGRKTSTGDAVIGELVRHIYVAPLIPHTKASIESTTPVEYLF
jgi:hypothetical protein